MDIPIGAIINIGSKIAEYFGLIEGIDTKMTKLLQQSFNSARLNFEYAQNATGQNQMDYIKTAKDKFIEAVSVEENENKVLALAGLAMCQLFLKDDANAKLTIDSIKSLELSKGECNKAKVADVALQIYKLNPGYLAIKVFMPIPNVSYTKIRQDCFSKTKDAALTLIENIYTS